MISLLGTTALLLCALAAPLAAVQDRFAGWDEIVDPSFAFDPDERGTLGFSVRATSAVRDALREAEEALADGAPVAAARRLRQVVAELPNHVVQVAGSGRPSDSRWVGAGEWALFQLATRLPPDALAALASAQDEDAVATARAWRDLPALRRLAWRLEGLPEGVGVTATLSRLLAERGASQAARRAAAPARAPGGGAAQQLLCELGPEDAAPSRATEPLPREFDQRWGASLSIERLAQARRGAENPFIGMRRISDEARFAPVRPVIEDGVVYVADSISLSAHELLSGRPLWHHTGPVEQIEGAAEDLYFPFHVYSNPARPRAISPYQCSWPVVAGDLLVATVQAAVPRHELDEFEGYPINHPLPQRRLRAVDRHTGELVWVQERSERPEAFVNRFDAHGPPVVDGGVVYVSGSVTEGAINAYVAAFDLEDGELLWRTLLCSGQQELTMFNRPFQEHLVSPLLLHEGALTVSTNLGVVGQVDAWSGRLRWLAGYKVIPREGARSVRPDDPRPVYWLNAPPFVEEGVLFVAPVDSRTLLALDPSTGKRRWELSSDPLLGRRIARHQALPTGRGTVIVVTSDGTEGYDALTGEVVWPHRPLERSDLLERATVTGAATLHGDVLLLPADNRVVAVDPQDGEVVGVAEWPLLWGRSIQRVALAGPVGVLVSGGGSVQEVAGGWAALGDEALGASLARLASATLPEALLAAEAGLARGQHEEARRLYERVLASRPGRGIAQRASTGRLEAALRAARSADTPAAWNHALEAAGDALLLPFASEALSALRRLGDEVALERWLAVLAERDGSALLDLAGDGPTPVAVLWTRYRLPLQPPERQVALLADLVLAAPDARWDGVPVVEEARRRIDELLALHGREAYESYEQAARDELAAGAPLPHVGRRYPNAEVVRDARLSQLRDDLQAGRLHEVFASDTALSGEEGDALRAEAAHRLGETLYAEWLLGQGEVEAPALPRLPGEEPSVVSLAIDDGFEVVFEPVTGRADPPFEHVVLGFVDRRGLLFAVDAAKDELLWSGRALPGRAKTSASGVRLHLAGDAAVVRGRNEIAGVGLAQGDTRWKHTLDELLGFEPVAGLAVCLRRVGERPLVVEAYGLQSGAPAWSVDLPGAYAGTLAVVGRHVVVASTSTPRGVGEARFFVLDAVSGRLLASHASADEHRVVATQQQPPLLLLAPERSGSQPHLAAFSPERGLLWDVEVPVGLVTPSDVLEVGPGRLLLRTSVPVKGQRRLADELLPIDAAHGPEGPRIAVPDARLVQREGGAATSLVVFKDQAVEGRLLVLDGGSGALLYERRLDEALRDVQMHPARDGFVLAVSSYDPVDPAIWVVRAPGAGASYRIAVGQGRQASPNVFLADGTVLVATGGVVHLVRSRR